MNDLHCGLLVMEVTMGRGQELHHGLNPTVSPPEPAWDDVPHAKLHGRPRISQLQYCQLSDFCRVNF